ncbi:hypothetical protein AAVH_18597, partial [Aphelenchoides avenae]
MISRRRSRITISLFPCRQRSVKGKAVLKEEAVNSRATLSGTLASDAHEGLSDEAIQGFPSQRNLQQVVNRIRKIPNAAQADKPPSELVIPDQLRCTLRGERFLIVDTRESEPEKPPIFAFASPDGIRLLRKHREWCVDGTFYSAPRHFKSLVTINVFVDDKATLPAVWILMPDHRQQTYRRALDAIFDVDELRDVEPTSFVSDFEKGLINAISDKWPSAEERLEFHLFQSLFRNIQQKKLLPLYDIAEVRILLRSFGALAHLPGNEVVSGYNQGVEELGKLIGTTIPVEYKQPLKDFVLYFKNTYIGHVEGRRFIKARFGIDTWNCFMRTINGNARTNNSVEGWHAHLNAMFAKANMLLTQFIVRVKKEEERVRNLAVRHRATQLKECVDGQQAHLSYSKKSPGEREAGRVEYLRQVQFHLSPSAFARLMSELEKENNGQRPSQSQQMDELSTQDDTQRYLVDLELERGSAPSSQGSA